MKTIITFLLFLLPLFCSAQFYEQEVTTPKNTYVESNFDGLGFSIIQIYQMPTDGVLTIDSSVVNSTIIGYQPNLDFVGRDTFIADFSADVLGIPLLPVMIIFVVEDTDPNAVDDTALVYPGFPITIAVAGNDNFFTSNDVVTLLSSAQNGTASVDTSQNIMYQSNPNYIGTEILDYQICNANICDTATLTIQVDTSQVQSFIQHRTIEEGMSFVEDFSFYNALGIFLGDYIINQNPSNGITEIIENEYYTDPVNGDSTYYILAVKYTPNSGFIGSDSYSILSCSNQGECYNVIVDITVLPQGGTFSTTYDLVSQYSNIGSFIITPLLNDSGVDLNISNIGSPSVGTATLLANNEIEYTIANNFIGQDSLTYTVCDYVGNCATENIYITIDSAVTNPGDNIFYTETYKNTPLYFDFTGSPIDQFNILAPPSNGTIDYYPNGLDVLDSTGVIVQSFTQVAVYTPSLDYLGNDVLTAQVVFTGILLDVVIQIGVVENPDNDLVLRIVDMNEQMNGVVSTNELEENMSFDIFPNPTRDILNIRTDQIISNIRIIDVLGRDILMRQNNEMNPSINIATLNQGTYIIQLEINGEFYNSIFIKR